MIRDARTQEDFAAFAAINREWVERYFTVELEDERLFRDPEAEIIAKGGIILIAEEGGKTLGACALIPLDAGDFEFSKMGVVPEAQGRGIGQRLLEAAISRARAEGAKLLLICTSSSLGTANRMYRRFGFVDSTDPRHHAYDRADVFLEFVL